MTDEETDDNDRMERANRIREMREGRRRGTDDDDDEETTADQSDTEEETTESDTADESDTETTTEEPEVDDEPETADEHGGATSESTTDATAAESSTAESTHGTETQTETATQTEAPDTQADESGFEFEGDQEGTAGQKVETDRPAGGAGGGRVDTTVEGGVANAVADTEAADAVDQLGIGGTFAIPEQATTVSEEDEQAMIEEAEQSVAAARAAVAGRETAHAGDRTRVLEFELGGERFCLDIDYIEEIVELENMTRVPNSPSYVEGVVDLRGQVTAIINPKDALEVEKDGEGELIIVFDSEKLDEQGNLGWVVDEVRQVTPVSEDEVNESPEDEDEEHINGIINREDEEDFIVWTTPELALNSS